jgi:hypothetical protein
VKRLEEALVYRAFTLMSATLEKCSNEWVEGAGRITNGSISDLEQDNNVAGYMTLLVGASTSFVEKLIETSTHKTGADGHKAIKQLLAVEVWKQHFKTRLTN